MPGPLAGLRVLELARILAGPWAGQILADLGADVIKVERKGAGDDTRGWGPPFVAGADGSHLGAAYFHATNRGKRSIELDFETDEGQRLVRKLAARSDVLIENFKVGGLTKFGLDYESLAPRNPAADLLLGHRLRPERPLCVARRLRPDGAGHRRLHEPHRQGGRRADARRRSDRRHLHRRLFGGRHPRGAARARQDRHRAAHVDTALVDTQVGMLANQALNYLVSGELPVRHRQRASQHRALPGVPGRRRPHHHRHRQRQPVREAVRRARRARRWRRARTTRTTRPARQSRRAGRAAHRL